MSQADGDFIEMKDANANKNSYAEMFSPAGNTDLSTYIHTDSHELDLFDSGFHGAKDGAISYMGIRNHMLPLGSHNGGLKNFRKNIRKFSAKIYCYGTDALGCQFSFSSFSSALVSDKAMRTAALATSAL